MRVPLRRIAHARSGDKGNVSNVGVFAYEEALYPFIKDQLTAERFADRYRGVVRGKVTRHPIDGIAALNFVAEDALGGGVSRNLCLDNYGKTLAAAVLDVEIEIPAALAPLLRGA